MVGLRKPACWSGASARAQRMPSGATSSRVHRRSRVGTRLRSIGWVVSPVARCHPLRLCTAVGTVLAVLIDGAVHVPLVLTAKEEHLVDVPAATERSTVLALQARVAARTLGPSAARSGWTRRCHARPAAPSRSYQRVGAAGPSERL